MSENYAVTIAIISGAVAFLAWFIGRLFVQTPYEQLQGQVPIFSILCFFISLASLVVFISSSVTYMLMLVWGSP
jgi:hypothetical protein